MRLVGLTGGISSGKSTVSKLLVENGYVVIDCDKITADLYKIKDFKDGLIKLFGGSIVNEDNIDKKKLGRIVFSDNDKLSKLNNYCGPFIENEILKQLNMNLDKNIVFIDAPILIESGLINKLDFTDIWVVSVSKDIQIQRLKKRNPEKSDKDIENILKNQISQEERESYATFIIDNNGSLNELKQNLVKGLNNLVLCINRDSVNNKSSFKRLGVVSLERKDKIDYYLDLAQTVAQRSTCLRRKYGAVIVKNDEIISTGYNGAPRGCTNCTDIGSCKREEMNIPSGERYELCRSVHAEQNAIISAARKDMIGSTLYLSGIDAKTGKVLPVSEPCSMCKRFILNSGISQVIMRNGKEYDILETSTWRLLDII